MKSKNIKSITKSELSTIYQKNDIPEAIKLIYKLHGVKISKPTLYKLLKENNISLKGPGRERGTRKLLVTNDVEDNVNESHM